MSEAAQWCKQVVSRSGQAGYVRPREVLSPGDPHSTTAQYLCPEGTRSSALLTDSFRTIFCIFIPIHPVSLDAEIYVESVCKASLNNQNIS
jgi:hypothetical protein